MRAPSRVRKSLPIGIRQPRAKVRRFAPESCNLPAGSYLFGLSALAPSAAYRRAFRPMSATLAKLREPGGRHVPADP